MAFNSLIDGGHETLTLLMRRCLHGNVKLMGSRSYSCR